MSAPADYTPPSEERPLPYSPATAQQRYLGETESGYEKRMRVQRDMKDLLDVAVLKTIPVEEWTTEEYRMMRAYGEVPVNSVDVAR